MASTVPSGGYSIGSSSFSITVGSRTVPVQVRYPATSSGTNTPRVQGRKFAMIVVGHGAALDGLASAQQNAFLVRAGYVVVAPSYQRNLFGAAGFAQHARETSAVITEVLRRAGLVTTPYFDMIDPERIGYRGASMGGMIGVVVGWRTDVRDPRVKAVAVVAGSTGIGTGSQSFTWSGGPAYFGIHGANDSIVPYNSGKFVYDSIQGTEKGWVGVSGMGHDFVTSSTILTEGTLGFFAHTLYDGTPEQGIERIQRSVSGNSVNNPYLHAWVPNNGEPPPPPPDDCAELREENEVLRSQVAQLRSDLATSLSLHAGLAAKLADIQAVLNR